MTTTNDMADEEITPQRSSITKQPQPQPSPTYEPTTTSFDEWQGTGDGAVHLPTLSGIKQKVTTREGWLGDFDVRALRLSRSSGQESLICLPQYGFLCLPQLPFSIGGKPRVKSTPFYALNDNLPILIAVIVGFVRARPSTALSVR